MMSLGGLAGVARGLVAGGGLHVPARVRIPYPAPVVVVMPAGVL